MSALIVSLHDVSPHTFQESRAILEKLERLGVVRLSLLVIKNHHHLGDFSQHPEFCNWLKSMQEKGHEIVIHGYHHFRNSKNSESFLNKLITNLYTNKEGEFFDINFSEAYALCDSAKQEFSALGFDAVGFVAPAWLLSADAERALEKLNFDYTTRISNITDFKISRSYQSQSMVYSVRSSWRRSVSLVWNELLRRHLGSKPLMRMGIHPPDIRFPDIWNHIEATILSALEYRTPLTYQAWVLQQRP